MATLASTLYLVVRDYGPQHGLGSPDITGNEDQAYDEFSTAVDEGDPVTVWKIDTTGSEPYRLTDVTDKFEHEMQEICIRRGMDLPNVHRFEMPRQIMAAE